MKKSVQLQPVKAQEEQFQFKSDVRAGTDLLSQLEQHQPDLGNMFVAMVSPTNTPGPQG